MPILLLVPLRHRILPRFFRNPKHLNELDAAHQEVAEPLSREQALEEAASQGLAAAGSGASRARSEAGGLAAPDGGGDGGSDGDMLPDCEVQRLRVLHHLRWVAGRCCMCNSHTSLSLLCNRLCGVPAGLTSQHCQLARPVPPVTPTQLSLSLIPSSVNLHLLAATSPSHGGGRAWRQGSHRHQCHLTRLCHPRQL